MATMTTRQQASFTIQPEKADGTPADIDTASVVVASSDETVLTISDLVVAAGMITGNVVSVAAGGPARFTVQADADLGPGVSDITGVSEDITVTADPRDQASTFVITVGAPTDKP